MRDATIRKVLVLGSGPIKIGQAAEFDYAGTQACRALKEEGCSVILLNSNPATIQTDSSVADVVYIRPLLPDVVEEILKEHNPDGVVATLGGQTGLNLCMECEKLGIWKRHKCRVLGTQPDAVERAEAREPFRRTMLEAGQPIIASRGISSVAEAQEFALHTPLPLILRLLVLYSLVNSGLRGKDYDAVRKEIIQVGSGKGAQRRRTGIVTC